MSRTQLPALLAALTLPFAAPAATLEKRDLLVSLGYFIDVVDPVDGSSDRVATATPSQFFGGIEVDGDGQVYVTDGVGISRLDPVTEVLTPFSSRFGAISIGRDDALYVLEGGNVTQPAERVYRIGPDGSSQLVFDADALPGFAGQVVSDFAVQANGTLLLLGSDDDDVFSYVPGALDVSVLTSGGLLTSRPANPGAEWKPLSIDIGRDGTIYVGTSWFDGSIGSDLLRVVSVDSLSLAQGEAAGGATADGPGDLGQWTVAIDLDGNPLVAHTDSSAGADFFRLIDGMSDEFYSPDSPIVTGITVYPIPEPSTLALIALGLVALGRRARR